MQTNEVFAIRKRRKTFAVEMDALARSSDTQRSFLSGAADGTRTRTEVKFWQILSLLCLPIPTQRHIQKMGMQRAERKQERNSGLLWPLKIENA